VHTDLSPNEASLSQRSRHTHLAGLMAKVVADCRVEVVHSAAVAMAYGINANVADRWFVENESRNERASIASVGNMVPTFVPMQMSSPALAPDCDSCADRHSR
jgi:hypothetical protein